MVGGRDARLSFSVWEKMMRTEEKIVRKEEKIKRMEEMGRGEERNDGRDGKGRGEKGT